MMAVCAHRTTHLLTRETRGDLQNQFHYDTYGLLDQATGGISTSPSVTTITPAVRRGLGGLYKNPEDWTGNTHQTITRFYPF